jgi:integral membrane protein
MRLFSEERNLSMATSTAANEDLTLIRRLRLAAFVEATTLLTLLLVAVPLKHAMGYAIATRVMGPVHGAAFVAYAWCVIATASGGGDWTRRELTRLIVGAFIPFGGFANAGLLRRKEAAAVARAGRD